MFGYFFGLIVLFVIIYIGDVIIYISDIVFYICNIKVDSKVSLIVFDFSEDDLQVNGCVIIMGDVSQFIDDVEIVFCFEQYFQLFFQVRVYQ